MSHFEDVAYTQCGEKNRASWGGPPHRQNFSPPFLSHATPLPTHMLTLLHCGIFNYTVYVMHIPFIVFA